MTTAQPLIEVTGLTKNYNGQPVIRDVTLRLPPGSMMGLVGTNGGGKTTTLRMLAGLLRPDAGRGTVLGDDVRQARLNRRLIGYMGQRLALYPDLSVLENLRFHSAVHGLANRAQRIAQLIEQYELTGVRSKPFGLLSGGWARRVQFAATMLHAPPLLLLDEPTAGLDTVTRRSIWHWLAELARAGHGIVVSTHDLAEAEHCSAILLFRDGLAHGPTTPAALLAQTGTPSLDAAVLALAGTPS